MADGRHFKNGFIAISQPEIMGLNEIWCADADCASNTTFQLFQLLTKTKILQIQNGGRPPY